LESGKFEIFQIYGHRSWVFISGLIFSLLDYKDMPHKIQMPCLVAEMAGGSAFTAGECFSGRSA
jgi:hypothetical protein